MNVPFDEQETIINFAPRRISTRVSVYSCMPNVISKILKLREKHPDDVQIVKADEFGTEFSVPYDWVSIRPKRQLSDEQKQIMIERLRKK